jgi:uncharacterized protein
METTTVKPGLLGDGESAGGRPAWDGVARQVRINVRPVASPSGIGLFGLAAGTFVLAGSQLDWVSPDEGRQVGVILVGFAFVSQLLAAIISFLARDIVVSSAMTVLAVTWLVIGAVSYLGPPGSTSDALGLLLLVSSTAMLVIGLTASLSKLVPALVFLTASVRFALTGVYQLTDDSSWKTAAGLVGLFLAALAVYAASALLLEGAVKQTVLPLGRRDAGATALGGSLLEQLRDIEHEPGVRQQL